MILPLPRYIGLDAALVLVALYGAAGTWCDEVALWDLGRVGFARRRRWAWELTEAGRVQVETMPAWARVELEAQVERVRTGQVTP